jgi:sarcosine oxidase/L-pipecolate oxidase
MASPPPKSILIVGSGAFGLSTAYALTHRPSFANTTITVLEYVPPTFPVINQVLTPLSSSRSPFPSPDGSSIDTSRIIRADYSDPSYASLGAAALQVWRQQGPNDLGGSERYSESGLVLVADKGKQGEEYVQHSFENVSLMMQESNDPGTVQELKNRKEIDKAVGTGGGSGDWGYINLRSGWADAEAGMVWLKKQVEATKKVTFLHDEAVSLIFSSTSNSKVLGVNLKSGTTLTADLIILATGAWTGKLIDLRGRAQATGQVICYLSLTQQEQDRLGKIPVLLNMSTGLFIIPPRNRVLKVARHGYGYSNPILIPHPEKPNPPEDIEVSLPRTILDDPNIWVPLEGETACRKALSEMIPSLASRPFTKSKICWYTDTPKGDFLITYHPEYKGLFLATGGSGHGYKFLPIIGEKIVDCVEGRCPEEFREKWGWPRERVEMVVTEDGSRGERPGMVLEEELRRGGVSKL